MASMTQTTESEGEYSAEIPPARSGISNSLSRWTKTFEAPRFFNIEMLLFSVAALAALASVWTILSPSRNIFVLLSSGTIFTVTMVIIIRLEMDPDSIRARQTDSMLRLASLITDQMQDGVSAQSAQYVCRLLLPNTAAVAVAITDKRSILGYAGYDEANNHPGSPIRTLATHNTLKDGSVRVLYSPEDIGIPGNRSVVKAAIIVPLEMGREVVGTLKFYYRRGSQITETRKSIAMGFGRLISVQLMAAELEAQRDLAAAMELKMLQSQINPHFLFNTINTIASLIRTDPAQARILLREFAVFYRRMLEDTSDQILLSRELEQVSRYFAFEIARFGEERVELQVHVPEELEELLVPPFIIQPLVENAVQHAMPPEGKLVVEVKATVQHEDVVIDVRDNGKGMSEETCANVLHPESSTGTGIALKNVHDRMKGVYGPKAQMNVESALGEGTMVSLRFPDAMPAIRAEAERRAAKTVAPVTRVTGDILSPSGDSIGEPVFSTV